MPTDQDNVGIAAEYYFSAAEGVAGNLDYDSDTEVHQTLNTLVFCVLVLNDGRTVTGESSPVPLADFVAEEARKAARANAVTKAGPLNDSPDTALSAS